MTGTYTPIVVPTNSFLDLIAAPTPAVPATPIRTRHITALLAFSTTAPAKNSTAHYLNSAGLIVRPASSESAKMGPT
ncbi:hypothetical protein L3X38_004085 [Prunus dulcis]|uniref:Uncharacterized protein n=1 Tax=Prunus dulcis TaxID=3755 RepID=A0AAD4ZNB0_PRUDU|nr:hypothetical protein L3X38_004085 [Prunus dulcis]